MTDALNDLPSSCRAYADCRAWELKSGKRYEIICEEAYMISVPDSYHRVMLTELLRQIVNFPIGKFCKVYPAPFDVRLFYREDESDDTVVQPDISVVCDEKKRVGEICLGVPDFVAEILSPSNTAIEMQRKFDLYCDADVREYWVLAPRHKHLAGALCKIKRSFARSFGKNAKRPVFPVNLKLLLQKLKFCSNLAYLFEGKTAFIRICNETESAIVAVLDGLSIELRPVFAE